MTTTAQTVTRNAPETDSRKTQVTVSRAIHVLSTEDEPRQVMSQRDRTCRNLESEENPAFRLLLCTWQLETALREPVTDLASFRSDCSFPAWENRGFHENIRFCHEIRPLNSNNSCVSTIATIAFVSIKIYCCGVGVSWSREWPTHFQGD